MMKIKDKSIKVAQTGFADVDFQVCTDVTIVFYLFDFV